MGAFLLWSAVMAAQLPPAQPLYGNATLGYYYLQVGVGTPPQPQTLIIDTGSYATIFACRDCKGCNRHINAAFDPERSSTLRRVRSAEQTRGWVCRASGKKPGVCTFYQGYLEGSVYEGYRIMDVFTFERESSVPAPPLWHVAGCATRETNEFHNQAVNGIIGLSVRQGAGVVPPTIVEESLMADRSPNLQFSICIAHDGGLLRLSGGNPDAHLPGAAVGVLRQGDSPWSDVYRVVVTEIRLGATRLPYDFAQLAKESEQAFFDTGTTFTYFSEELFGAWSSTFTAFCRQRAENCAGHDVFEECYDFPNSTDVQAVLRSFPPATFTFRRDVPFVWHPQDYFMRTETGICIGVRPLKNLILGAVFMRNYDFTFDQQRHEVRFARADCAGVGGVLPGPVAPHARPLRLRGWLARAAPVVALLLLTL